MTTLKEENGLTLVNPLSISIVKLNIHSKKV